LPAPKNPDKTVTGSFSIEIAPQLEIMNVFIK